AAWDAAQRGVLPTCHPDTCRAIQDDLIAWRTDLTAGPVRLILGWAGTGKTTIAQTMAKYWAAERCLAASFFFSRSSSDTDNTHRFHETIADHLFQHLLAANAEPEESRIHTILRTFRPVIFPSGPMVIIVDGLDECCDPEAQTKLLQDLLTSIVQLGPSAKLLIACRPEVHLQDVFNKFGLNPGSPRRFDLSPDSDIERFLQDSLQQIYENRRADGTMSAVDEPWPSKGDIAELVDRASGQFIFAATALSLIDNGEEDPVKMLKIVL
ncbi:hypothetical protein BDN72DRAFT_916478, partial [Pluteus cervinus]